MSFKNFHTITEGINDKFPLKAIFIVGVAGAGKTSISSPVKFFAKHIDIDYPQEVFSKKLGVNISHTGTTQDKNKMHRLGERVTLNGLTSYVDGMLPLVINVVGDDIEHTKTRIKILRNFGYDVGMIYVNIDLEQSIERVAKRLKVSGRHVPGQYVYDSYQKLLVNVKKYQDLLYDHTHENVELLDYFLQINNSGENIEDVKTRVFKEMRNFFSAPIKNQKGLKYLEALRKSNGKVLSDLIDQKELHSELSKWFK